MLKDATGGGGPAPLAAAHLDPSAAIAALEAFADLCILLDRDGMIRAVSLGSSRNPASELNFPARRAWTDGLAADSLGKARDMLAAAQRGDPPRPREINHLGALPGRTIPIRYIAVAHGREGEVLLIGRDLQEQAALQRQLIDVQQSMERDYSRMRAVETRYRALFQLAGAPMLIVETATRKVLEANGACLASFGLTAQRMSGRTIASLFDEHDGEALQGLLSTAMSAGEAKGAVLRAATGSDHFELSAHLFRQEGASLLLVQARPLAEASHGGGNDIVVLPSLIERLPEGFVVTDGEGLVLEANRTFLDIAALPMASTAIGQSLGQWLGRSATDFGIMLTSLLGRGVLRGFPTVIRGSFGAEEPVDVSAVKIVDHGAPRIGFLIRQERRDPAGAYPAGSSLPRSVEQMKELVGNVPLRELVRETTDVIERLCIEAALELTNDNRASAADMLGLSRQSLYAKLHRFGLGDLGKDETS
ncbi:MAG: transcriptional regulator PpsR [Methylocystis sp.]|nr:transcriptional regulator PpsR [Methylocystis sp.]MCA3583730.1 transcriptional regulator PpsR [Methylocystis sp.]MCA3587742.1 transcriptional regulator PpsR [Methylocystis sp.]MCA3589996.1 transcriptional regulator PpsR [Methylocystis sp.]